MEGNEKKGNRREGKHTIVWGMGDPRFQEMGEQFEGIVEIREDYISEASNEDKATTAGDDDFARILSRIDELEKEELESEIAEEGEEKEEADIEPEVRNSELKESPDIPVSKDSLIKVPTPSGSTIPVRLVEHDKLKERVPPTPVSRNEGEVSALASNSSNASSKATVSAPVSKEVSNFGSRSSDDRSKAFTGSIVERTHNIENSQTGQTPAAASKPVSRFKLQRK